jgi:hypothetical protein
MNSADRNTIAVLTTDKTVNDKEVNQELRSIWELLRTDERLREQARQAGIEDVALQRLPDSPYVSERREGQFGIAETIFIAVTSQIAKDVAKTLWDKVIWPRLARRFGAALRQQSDDSRR